MKKDLFFGREAYLEILKKRINGLKENYRQNIAIIGEESIGKTSLLFKLLDSLCDNQIILLYLEARPQSIDAFAKRFIGVLLYSFLGNSGIPLKEDLDYLIKKSQRYAPGTVEKIREILKELQKRKKNNILSELFSLCEIIHAETSKSCVVIIDEFQNLESMELSGLYREWSKILLLQKNTMYIITSSRKAKARGILAKDLSLLFGNFEVICMEAFDIKESSRYLERRLQGLKLEPVLSSFIVHFTGGWPLYLELISEALQKQNNPDLADALECMLFNSSGLLHQKFSLKLKAYAELKNSNDYISILYLVASGRNKIKDIAHLLRKTRTELSQRVNQLLETDALFRNADFLKINDRVFGFWLNSVHQEKLQSLTFDTRNQKIKFRDSIEEAIKEFRLSTQRPLGQRLQELLWLFEDELLQSERKKIRLNHFREIKPLEFQNLRLKNGLIGRSQDGLWVMGFKQGRLNEEDITEFARECKKYRHKQQKNIIVTLNDIDANTRLKALEEKVWAWDINKLNQILDLFSKPWVIA